MTPLAQRLLAALNDQHPRATVPQPLGTEPPTDPAASDTTLRVRRERQLTPLDADILQRTAHGQLTVQMAHAVHLSPQGVEYHVSRMLRRFRVANRAGLVARVYHLGLMQPGVWPPRVRPEFICGGLVAVPRRKGTR